MRNLNSLLSVLLDAMVVRAGVLVLRDRFSSASPLSRSGGYWESRTSPGGSETRRQITRPYDAAAGIESFALAAPLRRTGADKSGVRRGALPHELVSHAVLGPDDRVFFVPASRKKGIRSHFHESATPEFRSRVLARFADDPDGVRRAVAGARLRLDETVGSPPGDWWRATVQVLSDMESRREPVKAVGKLVLG